MSFLLESEKNLEAERNLYLDQSGVLSLINQSFLREGDDEDDARHSRILRKSCKGMDPARKSVIQQQSEKYIMNKKRMPGNKDSVLSTKSRQKGESGAAQRVAVSPTNNAHHQKTPSSFSISKISSSILNLKGSNRNGTQTLSKQVFHALATEPADLRPLAA